MIRLFFNYYEDKHPFRKREIDFCLQKNLDNPYIKTIIIESAIKPSYDYFFRKINEVTQDNDINIICNSDIFFDESIVLADQCLQKLCPKEMYALSRWDWHLNGTTVFFDRADSQDTWIVRGKVDNVQGNFTLGIRGCDNKIAYQFGQSGYRVRNPSKSIKTYHVHNSQVRNYTMADVVPPPYLTVDPTHI
jgi:hypothetical protein